MVKRDTSKLSRRDKLELVLSEAPELPALLGELRAQLETLTESVQPLVSNVTADLGASKDGLVYLCTRQQLLLAYCMNVCFYMVLKVTAVLHTLSHLVCMTPKSLGRRTRFPTPRACLLSAGEPFEFVGPVWVCGCP